jgi:hypothetical protein
MPAYVSFSINSLMRQAKKMRHMPQLNKAYDAVFLDFTAVTITRFLSSATAAHGAFAASERCP